MAAAPRDLAHPDDDARAAPDDPRAGMAADPIVSSPSLVSLVPAALLAAHACLIPGDTLYHAAARLRQARWHEDLGLAPDPHHPGGASTNPPSPLGPMLTPADAARGLNFVIRPHEVVWV